MDDKPHRARLGCHPAASRLGDERSVPRGGGTGCDLPAPSARILWRQFTYGLKIRMPLKRIA